MGEPIHSVAHLYPNVSLAVVDYEISPAVSNVESLIFYEDYAGFLAGN